MTFRVQKTALAALVPVLLFAAGCSSGHHDDAEGRAEPRVLGFSQLDANANWNKANTESIRQAAQAAGIELRIVDANRSQEKQVAALRAFVSQRVDVIAFSPAVESGWEGVLREIRAAGIPVILMDRAIEVSDDSLYRSLIGSDFVEEGRRAARWLLENTRDLPGEIGIAELRGSLGSAPANDRQQGFAEVVVTDRRYRVIRSESADFNRARAREIMAQFLAAEGRRIRVVFAHSDTMALGAIEAMESAGVAPGRDVLVVSIEGKREALEAIVAGKLNATVECNPLLGPALIDVVTAIEARKPVPKRVVTRESLFTIENAAAELPGRAY